MLNDVVNNIRKSKATARLACEGILNFQNYFQNFGFIVSVEIRHGRMKS